MANAGTRRQFMYNAPASGIEHGEGCHGEMDTCVRKCWKWNALDLEDG